MNENKIRITVCADDYGLSPGVDDAIIILAEDRKISAISCMTIGPEWNESGIRLKALNGTKIGLHLCLSSLTPITQMPLFSSKGKLPSMKKVIGMSFLRLINEHEIRKEISAQLESFQNVIGRFPDFIDGHQHLHQLPVISDALIDVLIQRKISGACIVRNTSQENISKKANPKLFMKKVFLDLLGRNFREKLRKKNIRTNGSLSGIYLLDEEYYNSKLFHDFLSDIKNDDILVCHPALVNDVEHVDPYGEGRVKEFHFLKDFNWPAEFELV